VVLNVVSTVSGVVAPSRVKPDSKTRCDSSGKGWFGSLEGVRSSVIEVIEGYLSGIAFRLGRQTVRESLGHFHSLAGVLIGQERPDEATAGTAEQPELAGARPLLGKELNPVALRVLLRPLLHPLLLVHGLHPLSAVPWGSSCVRPNSTAILRPPPAA
jgi:hypothetical protein